jgi:hypothetical protein
MRTLLPILALAACDPLAGRDYVGEPLITLTGTFAPTSAAPSDPVGGVALMWQDPDGAGGPGKAATSVPVAMEFPASFSIAVPTPPPDGVALVFGDGSAVAEAYIFVVGDVGEAHPTRLLGAERAHALIYAPSDIAAGSATGGYLGGAVSAGYHLRRYVGTSDPPPAQAEALARCMTTGPADACKARRAYQLAATGDDEPLRIVLWPP